MNKRLAGRITLLSIFLIALFGTQGVLMAQDAATEFVPAFLVNTTDGIVFYGVNLENEVDEIGRLPAKFGIYDPDETSEWQINPKGNFVVSPNRQHIALVAHKRDESVGVLHIYHFQSQDLETAAVVDECDGLYQPRISWSPDSEMIKAELGHCSKSVLYRLSDKQHSVLATDYIFNGYWGNGSDTLLYRNASNQITLVDTHSGQETTLANFEKVNLPALTLSSVSICNFVWAEALERWFFVVGCEDSSNYPDRTFDYLYSVNQDSEIHLELSLPDFYSAIYPQFSTEDANYRYIEIRSIIPAPSGLYIVVGFGWGDWSILYYEITDEAFLRPREISSLTDTQSWLTAFSPEAKSLALQYYDGTIHFRGLPGGEGIGEIEGRRDDTAQHNFGFWLDESRFLYARKDGGVGIFHIWFNERVDINLAVGLDGEVFILR